MARLVTSNNVKAGDIFISNQSSAFSSATPHVKAVHHRIDGLTPGEEFKFGVLEFVANTRGDLILYEVSALAEELENCKALTSGPLPDHEYGIYSNLDSALSQDLTMMFGGARVIPPEHTSYVEDPECGFVGALRISTRNISWSNEMMAQVQTAYGLDKPTRDPSSPGTRCKDLYSPPSTHFVATIEDLTDLLGFSSEEAEDMDTSIQSPSPAITRRWTETSKYDVYMVDNPRDEGAMGKSDDDTPVKNSGDEPVKRHRQHKKPTARKGNESNTCTGNNSNPDDIENPTKSPKPDDPVYDPNLPAYMDTHQPEDLGNSEDNNYVPPVEEGESLGDEDFIIPEDALDQEVFTQQLIATAWSLKLKRRQRKAEQDSINERWY
ncbi:hypothetical protein D1007_18397 [Hordeum vulgare]|nr:hypothetical protein D1007_18397 [Hordeum vulgare]